MMTELSLRETFDTAAARYHRARPGYPEELFDDLVDLARLDNESRILEIGPGTGIATEPLARRGYSILGVDLGPALAVEARKNLSTYRNVTIDVGAFETYPFEPGTFDLVYAATAFHWIEQPLGYRRVASILKRGGYFAEFRHHHVWSPETDRFYHESQEVYLKYDPATPPDLRCPLPDELETLEDEIEATGLFERPVIRRYMQYVEHTAESYTDLLLTFSGHILLPEPNRTNLIEGIADVIRGLPGGRAIKPHLIILHVARRKH